jgi:hypothetical protein
VNKLLPKRTTGGLVQDAGLAHSGGAERIPRVLLIVQTYS